MMILTDGDDYIKKLAIISWEEMNKTRQQELYEIAKMNDEKFLTSLLVRTMACSKKIDKVDLEMINTLLDESNYLTDDEKDSITSNVIESLKDYIKKHNIQIEAIMEHVIEAKMFDLFVCSDITYVVSAVFFNDDEMYEMDNVLFSMSDTVRFAIRAMRTDWDYVSLYDLSTKDEAEKLQCAVEHIKSDRVKLILKSDDFFDMKELEGLEGGMDYAEDRR